MGSIKRKKARGLTELSRHDYLLRLKDVCLLPEGKKIQEHAIVNGAIKGFPVKDVEAVAQAMDYATHTYGNRFFIGILQRA